MARAAQHHGSSSAELRVRLLGPFAVTVAGRSAGPWPRPSARRLCELVMVSPGRRVSRDLACEELFPGRDPRAAARSLSKALSMARAALAELGEPASSLLEADLDHIWVSPGVQVDADMQAAALHAGLGMAPGRSRDDTLTGALAEAAELLANEPYTSWAAGPRDRLESLRREARFALARDRTKGAGHASAEAVLAAWRDCFEHDPASEEAAGALIRAYSARGQRELAAATYERCSAALEALGLRVSPSLAAVYATATAASLATPLPAATLTLANRAVASPAVASPAVASPAVASPAVANTDWARPAVASPAVANTDWASPAVASPAVANTDWASGANGVAAGPTAVFATAAAAATASPPGGEAALALREELRTVSVLFAEVAVPDGLTRKLGPEGLRQVIGGFLAAVIAEVEALGGIVTSVSGYGMQAMFGAPTAHEDDPERAARAAFRAFAATATAAGSDAPKLRIGIESGPAVLGPVGGGTRVEYAPTGEVVRIAAALQSSARPGAALVGPVTRAATDHLFSWGPDENVQLGHDSTPVAAAYLGEPTPSAGGRSRRLGGSGALVGRDHELAVLDTALRDAVKGRGSLVLLTGEPGLGKTRLVRECRNRFMAFVGAGTGRLPSWLEGRCTSYSATTPYALYQQLVGSWAGAAPDRGEPVLRPALERALVATLGDAAQLPVLVRMMGLASEPLPASSGPAGRMGPEELQRATFSVLCSVVKRLAAAGPTVIVLEDLHWADPTSLRLTRRLAGLAAERSLLILATSRPDAAVVEASLGPAGIGDVPVHQIRLGPLPPAAELELARSLIGATIGQDVLDQVLASVDGNPLFLEEQLSSLLETGTLVRKRGIWRLRGAARIPVPQVLERLIRSRVDLLTPAAQEVIRTASVIGTGLTSPLLAAVSETGTLAAALDELCARDLLQEIGGEKQEFRFRHVLIQEATYAGLLQSERRRLHGRTAWALEALCECRLAENAAVIGRHFAAAGETEQALRYLEMAGDHATDVFANDEAISSYRGALEIADSQPAGDETVAGTVMRLCAKLANVLWRTAQRAEAREAFRQALRFSGGADAVQRAHLLTRLGRLEMADFDCAAAAAAFDAAADLLGDRPDCSDLAAADQWLELVVDGRAGLHVSLRQPDLALASLETARPVLEAVGSPDRKYSFYQFLALQRVIRNGLLVDGDDVACMRLSLAAAAAGSEEKDVGYATYFIGWFLLATGELAEAQRQLTAALTIADRVGEALLRGESLVALTMTAIRRRDVAAVRTFAPQAMEACEVTGSPPLVDAARAGLAWLAWQDGRNDDVIRLAAQASGHAPTVMAEAALSRAVLLFSLIAAHLAADQADEAVTAARELLERAQPRLADEVRSPLAAASMARDSGELGLAGDQLRAALAAASDLTYW
jgi:adenylate cyclase